MKLIVLYKELEILKVALKTTDETMARIMNIKNYIWSKLMIPEDKLLEKLVHKYNPLVRQSLGADDMINNVIQI